MLVPLLDLEATIYEGRSCMVVLTQMVRKTWRRGGRERWGRGERVSRVRDLGLEIHDWLI